MSLIERAASSLLGERIQVPRTIDPRMVPEGIVLRRGGLIPRIGGFLARMGAPAAAVTLRRTIVIDHAARLTPSLLAHEMAHVRQWQEDSLFPLRYTLATLRHGYRDNPYEIEARAIAAAASTPREQELA